MSDIDYSKVGEAITLQQIHELLLEDGNGTPTVTSLELHRRDSNPFLTADTKATDANGKSISMHTEMSQWDLNPIISIDSSKFDASGKLLRSAHSEVTKNSSDSQLSVETNEYAPGAVTHGSWKTEYKLDAKKHTLISNSGTLDLNDAFQSSLHIAKDK